jgi:hypothetical protein
MFTPTDQDFFDAPPMLTSSVYLFEPPKDANCFFSSTLILGMGKRITSFYTDPIPFAKTLVKYLELDLIDLPCFAFGVFPSLFAFFVNIFFAIKAADFFCQLVDGFKSPTVSSLFLVSFFISDRYFFTYLWEDLSARSDNFLSNTPISNLAKSIECTTRWLSPHRIIALRYFYEKHPKQCATTFIEQILSDQFERTITESCIIMNPVFINIFRKLFQTMPRDDSLLKIIISSNSPIECGENFLGIINIPDIPFLFSLIDIPLLYEIFLNDPKLSLVKYSKKVPKHREFTSVILRIKRQIITTIPTPIPYFSELFDISIPPIDRTENPQFYRVYHEIKYYSQIQGTSFDKMLIPIYLFSMDPYLRECHHQTGKI